MGYEISPPRRVVRQEISTNLTGGGMAPTELSEPCGWLDFLCKLTPVLKGATQIVFSPQLYNGKIAFAISMRFYRNGPNRSGMYDFLLNITICFIYIELFHQIYFKHNICYGCFVLYHEEDRALYDLHRTLVFVMFISKQPFTHLCSYENLWP